MNTTAPSARATGTVVRLERTHSLIASRQIGEQWSSSPLADAQGNILVPGDVVEFDFDRGQVQIAETLRRLPRASVYGRYDSRGDWKTAIANLEVLAVVYASLPTPRPAILRYASLFGAAADLEVWLVRNKSDLPDSQACADTENVWKPSFAAFFEVSAETGSGLADFARACSRRKVALVGSTGVGKSSIINAMRGTNARVGELSGSRGVHTTSRSTLYALGGGWILDTPGFEAVSANTTDKQTLDAMFPDIAALAAGCKFRDCRHDTDTGCQVSQATGCGALHLQRLREYCDLATQVRESKYAAANRILSRQVFVEAHKNGLI